MAMSKYKYLSKTFKFLIWITAGLSAFVLVYFIAVFAFSNITVNSHFASPEEGGIEIFLITNGMHTDIALPIKNELKDWGSSLPYTHTLSMNSTMGFAAFGWGDKGFYLETPTWADLKASTAFKASFWLGTSAMHVTYYRQLRETGECKRVVVSQDSYHKLVNFIENSFALKNDGTFAHIAGHSYAQHDAFYDAHRTYSLFYTCNSWTNEALKTSGLKACYWTPFDTGILKLYK